MRIENTIHIDAPPSVVWKVTLDVERWPEWTPTMESVKRLDEGSFDVGSTANIKQPGMRGTRWTVTSMVLGQRFSWEARILGMRMVATHVIESSGEGVQDLLRIDAHGITAVLLWPLVVGSLRKALRQENGGLKAWCEGLSRAG
jgi:carbon monoxide dehydrogenase subunit G